MPRDFDAPPDGAPDAVYAAEGVFLCFEGGDGSGKSTQARLLSDRLAAGGFDVLHTFEPGDTRVGQEIRRIVLGNATGHLADRTEALLYAADKAEHVEKVVAPALASGRIVITDRYVDSALAYQGFGRGLEPSGLEGVLRWATGGLRPHLTVVLDVEPADGLGRFDARDRIESESHDFHLRSRRGHLDLAAADPDHYLVLDGRASIEEIAARVWARVAPLLELMRS